MKKLFVEKSSTCSGEAKIDMTCEIQDVNSSTNPCRLMRFTGCTRKKNPSEEKKKRVARIGSFAWQNGRPMSEENLNSTILEQFVRKKKGAIFLFFFSFFSIPEIFCSRNFQDERKENY